MTTWHWVRHGPTHQKTFVGWRDVPADLSDHMQIERLNLHLPDTALLISSDLSRASATADAIAAPNRTRLPHSADLREMNFGLWDGITFQDVAERDPILSRAFWETPGDVQPPEGESWNMAAARVSAVVDNMNAIHPDAHIVAVAHIGVILTQLARAKGITPYEAIAHKIDNFSITEITWAGDNPEVSLINHLP